MTDHRAEAVRLLALAEGAYLDTSNDAAEREHYETKDDWLRVVEYELEARQKSIREAQMLAQMATAHALLAQLPPTEG
ncbi:hypothetical protein ABIA32_002741 [Streptacidiphilus sp. MAP12-20]|uniref:hypothetical protein n=1 Tax=Streptacidiphilus sp. MAP12-20 TaxID=3156299 RepID=UPI0035175C26